jgi:serine protease AprX
MRINLRHSLSTRLVLLVVAALVLALPSTALARGVAAPTRAFVTPHGKAKPKRGKKRHAPQRILVRPLVKKPSRRPAHPARPAASAMPKGHTPTIAAPVAASPAAAAPIPDTTTAEPTVAPPGQTVTTPTVEIPPAAVPTVDQTLAQVVEAKQNKEGDAARVRVIVYGPGAKKALAAVQARLITSLQLVHAVGGEIRAARIATLGLAEGVSRVAVDSPVKPTGTAATGDPYSALGTLYPRLDGATTAWSEGLNGAGVGVAVLDSGVATSADFGNRLTSLALPNQTSTADAYGHGSFVASVLGGKRSDGAYVGVAPASSLVALKVQRDDGSVYTSDVITALGLVLNQRSQLNLRVVNLSLSETVPSTYSSSPLDYAVEQLWSAGIVVVVSSGNSGANSIDYAPANDPYVITVGATDPGDTVDTADDLVASFSSYGTTTSGFAKPDILAPGRHVVGFAPAGTSLDAMAPDANHVAPSYVMANGTSFSAPQVTGAVALLLQKDPSLTPNQVKWLLTSTDRPVSGSTAGALDIAAAIHYAGTVGSANQGLTPSSGLGQDTAASSFN